MRVNDCQLIESAVGAAGVSESSPAQAYIIETRIENPPSCKLQIPDHIDRNPLDKPRPEPTMELEGVAA
jgi:hypothetical protein